MIGLMPRYVPRARNKRLMFTRTRRRSRRKDARRIASPESIEPTTRDSAEQIAMFDHGPSEFPVATIRPRDGGSHAVAALGGLQRWFAARWTWFQPRAMPCIVAALGMIAMIWTADYLAHHLDQPKPAPAAHQVLVGLGR